jgi:hypothetical protein
MRVVQCCVRPDAVGTRAGVLRRVRGVLGVRGVALLAAGSLGLSACSVASGAGPVQPVAASHPATTATPAPGTKAVQGPPGPQDPPTATTSLAPPLPNPVKSVPKVKRSGVTTTATVSAPAVGFSSAVVYPDGVRLAITKATKGIEQGHGPGVFAGREYVLLSLELTNGTKEPIDVDQVVVTSFYGKTHQLAQPVYADGAGARDFSGTVAPGARTTAAYAFAVPVKSLSDVTMVVDFDGVHTSATYRGAVKAS